MTKYEASIIEYVKKIDEEAIVNTTVDYADRILFFNDFISDCDKKLKKYYNDGRRILK